MAAVRIILLIVATALAAYWAHDFIQTGEPSMLVAMGLLVVGVGLAVLSAVGGLKKSGEKGE
ncbi:MAG: hypothetical protein NXI12_02605 [Alphaproteobacteria bacterium]|jgi:hypothetical protein|nr:hypothetical protein [Alphaproteobacteria bacterium]